MERNYTLNFKATTKGVESSIQKMIDDLHKLGVKADRVQDNLSSIAIKTNFLPGSKEVEAFLAFFEKVPDFHLQIQYDDVKGQIQLLKQDLADALKIENYQREYSQIIDEKGIESASIRAKEQVRKLIADITENFENWDADTLRRKIQEVLDFNNMFNNMGTNYKEYVKGIFGDIDDAISKGDFSLVEKHVSRLVSTGVFEKMGEDVRPDIESALEEIQEAFISGNFSAEAIQESFKQKINMQGILDSIVDKNIKTPFTEEKIKQMLPKTQLVDYGQMTGRAFGAAFVDSTNESLKELNPLFEELRNKLLSKNIDPDAENNEFKARLKEVNKKQKKVNTETTEDAAKKAGESTSNAFKGSTVAVDAINAITDALSNLVRMFEQLTKIEEYGPLNTIIPDILKASELKVDSQKPHAQREYIENALAQYIGSVDGDLAESIIKAGKNFNKKEADYYNQWAENVFGQIQDSGYDTSKFLTILQRSMNIGSLGLELSGKTTATLDPTQVEILADAIGRLSESTSKLDPSSMQEFAKALQESGSFSLDSESLKELLNVLIEISDVVQRATGVMSSSNLRAEFEQIQKSAEALGNGDLEKGSQDLQAIIDKFNAYKAAGGTKNLSDISQNTTLINNLQKVSEASEQAAQKQRELAEAEALANQAAESTKTSNIEASLKNIESSSAPKVIENMADVLDRLWTNSEASALLNAANLVQSQPVVDAIRSIVDALDELVAAFKRVNGDAALNLDELFNSIQKQAKSISNAKNYSVTGTARGIADDIYSRYLYYQQRGGDKELKVSKNLQSYWDSYTPEQKESIGLSAETKEFAEIEKAAMNAATAKELFVDANSEAFSAAQKTTAELEKERVKFVEVGAAAEDAAKHKDAFAKGFSQAFGNVGDLASYASALKSYAQILKSVGASEVKRNKLSSKDFTDFGDLKSLINGDSTLQQMYGQRLSNLDLQIGAFIPGVDSIDDVRKAMADLRADAETTATALSKAATNAATAAKNQNKKIADDFKDLRKNTKEINKLTNVETMNDVQKNYWNNYFKQFEAAQNSIAGKQLNDVAQKQVNASAQEIAKILEESVTLNQKIDEMSNSGGFTEDYITRLKQVKIGIKDIINAFPDGNFDISKVLGLDPAKLEKYVDSIRVAKVELGKSSENQMAKVADVQKTLNDALALKGASNNGKINSELDGLINKLDTAVQSSNGLKDSFTNMSSKELDEVTGSVVRLKGEMERTGARAITFGKNLASQMTSQMASLVAQYTSIRFMFRYAKQIAKTVTAVDSAITELRKVSGESNTRLAESFKTSAATAQELGATITDVINSTADWARLGYNIDQAEDLARVTQLLQTVGDNMTQETASKSLVSILQGYKIDASQAERTVDSINEVANNFAIDTAGIGEALQRSAAALNASGTDLNKSIALVTTSNAVLQNPETVGTMFKTMSARIRGATTELNELGEEEDEFTQTTSKLRDLVMQLTGFDIMKDENTYKDIYEIILGIGKEWKNLTDIEQASLGEALGGKRGINALFSVLNNTEGLEKAYKTALGAEGSAAREQAAYAQSVQYSIDRMKASAQELSVNFMSSDFLKGVVEGANTFLQLLTKIAEKLGTLGSIVTALGAIDLIKTLLTGGQRGLGGTVIMSLAKTLNGNNEIKGLGNAFKLITLKAGEAGTNAGGLMAKNMFAALASSPGAAVAGIAIATAIGVAIYSYLKKRQQDLINDAKTAANQWEEKQKTMSERYDEASSLRKQLEDETLSETQRLDIKKQIYEIQKQITSEYGAQASGIDLINGDLEEQKKLLTQISEAQARANLVEHASEYEAAIKKATGKYSGHAAEILGESDEFEQQLIKIITESGLDTLKYSFTNGDVGNLNIDYNGTAKEITEDVNTMIAKLQELRAEAENDKTSAILADPDNAKAISKNYDVQISAIDEAIEQFSSRTKKIRDGYEEIKSTYESYLEQEFFAAGGGILATEASDIASQLQDAIIEGNRSGAYALYKEYQKKESEIAELAKKISWDDGSLKVYMDSVKNGFDESSIEGFRLLDVLDMVNSSYNQVAEAADDYNKIVAEGNELGIDRGKTTYGNIDLEDRAVVNWDKETLKKYGDALKSWGRDTGEYEDIFREQGEAAAEAWLDGYVESYEGSYSTVDAGSSAFMIDGKEVEIAFTPLLQTGDGRAEYLDKNTVYDYINAVIQRASEEGDVSMENILRIDAGSTIEGFEGIHGLIADIGESAIQTGEAMHYIGTLGAENDAFERYTNVVGVLMDKIGDDNPFKDQAEDIIKYSTAIKSAGLDTVDVQQILAGEAVNATDEVKQAIMELLELTGMTGDALNNALAASGIIFGGVDKEIQHIQQSFSGFTNEMQKRYSNLDSLNGSLVAAVSGKGLNPFGEKDEEGNISSEVGNITKAFKDLDSFHPEDVFRHTANGIKLNEKELRRLQKEQDKVTHKKFLQKQKELTKQLADAERKRNSETNESKIRGYENEISTIRKSLMELGQLQAAYEGATSAYQKWLNAQSAGEAGDVYDNMRENMAKRADELYKEGLTGTEEFRALAELISGKDLSTANVDAVEAAYKNLDASIAGTSMTVRKFFEEGGKGADNFLQAMIDLGYATEENGIVSFEHLDTEEFAKKLGTSVDIVEAALNKLKDYGFEIQWFTKEQNNALKKFDKQYSDTIDKYKNVKFGRDERIFNVDELNTVEELEGAYNSIQEMLQNPTVFGIDDSQAQALSELLDVIIEKKDILAMPTGKEMFTVENYNIAKEALQQVVDEVEEANRLGLTSLTDSTKDAAEYISSLDDDIKDLLANDLGIELDLKLTKDGEELLSALGFKDNKKHTIEVTPAKKQAIQERVDKATNNTTTNTTVNKEITDSQTHSNVTVETSGEEKLDELTQKADEATKDRTGTATVETEGEKDVEILTQKEEEAAKDRVGTVTGKSKGLKEIEELRREMASIQSKSVSLTMSVSGSSAIHQAVIDWSGIKNGETKIQYLKRVYSTEGKPGQVNGTAHALGTLSGYAHASGKWGLPSNQRALINEVGPELVVRDSGWFIPNGGRPTMNYPLRKGDIIFNAKQTEELLKNGYVTRGYAHADGTVGGLAYAGATGSGNRKRTQGNSTTSSSSSGKSSGNSKSSGDSDSKKAAEEAAEEVKDWIEVLLDRITRAFENFKEMSDYWSSYVNKNRELNNAISQAQKNITYNQQAYARYMKQANSVGLSDKYAKQVQNGTIDIEKIKDEKLREKIEEYSEWYEKALDCKDTIRDLNKEVLELSRQKIDNLIEDYESYNELVEKTYDNLSKQNEVYEKLNGKGSVSLLESSAAEQNKLITEYLQARERIFNEMNTQIANGFMVKGSKEHRQAQSDIMELNNLIKDAELEIYNINEAIREVNWSTWNEALAVLEHMNSQLDSTIGLLDSYRDYNKDASITKNGITQFNLYSSALGNARQEVKNYQAAIDTLSKELQNGTINQSQYNEELRDYTSKQMAAVTEAKKYKDAIIDLIKEGIEAETSAMEKLIDKRKESLKRRKEEDDYARNVADKQKEITKIQAQLAALSGDKTMSTQAKVAKLQEELAQKQQDLADTRRDHEYDATVQALDDELTRFKEIQDEKSEALMESISSQEAAIEQTLGWTYTQYATTYSELTALSAEYGITLESNITDPWKNALAAVQEYQNAVNVAKTATATPDRSTPVKADVNQKVDSSGAYKESIKAPVVTPTTKKPATPTTKKAATTKAPTTTTKSKKIAGSFSGKQLSTSSYNKKDTQYLQKLLNAIQNAKLKVDGVYGELTKAAVKKFQKNNGLVVDGIFGPKSRTKLLSVAKAKGYARRGKRNASGLYITDEEGIGTEAIITKEGVLRQLDSDTVFSRKQTEALWDLSKMNLRSMLDNASKIVRRDTNVNLQYGSLLTVNGNVDRDALPGLQELLKQACEYTKRDMSATLTKMGLRGVL